MFIRTDDLKRINMGEKLINIDRCDKCVCVCARTRWGSKWLFFFLAVCGTKKTRMVIRATPQTENNWQQHSAPLPSVVCDFLSCSLCPSLRFMRNTHSMNMIYWPAHESHDRLHCVQWAHDGLAWWKSYQPNQPGTGKLNVSSETTRQANRTTKTKIGNMKNEPKKNPAKWSWIDCNANYINRSYGHTRLIDLRPIFTDDLHVHLHVAHGKTE